MVWYRPEPQPGKDKLEPRWKGPGKVLERLADHSYLVQVEPGKTQKAHRSQLHPHTDDMAIDDPYPMYYFSGKPPVLGVAPDDWEVEALLDHKVSPQKGLEVLVKWKGYEKPTWEPYGHLTMDTIVEYLHAKGISMKFA